MNVSPFEANIFCEIRFFYPRLTVASQNKQQLNQAYSRKDTLIKACDIREHVLK